MYRMSGRSRGRRYAWVASLARGRLAWCTRAWQRAWSKMNQRPASPSRLWTSQPAWESGSSFSTKPPSWRSSTVTTWYIHTHSLCIHACKTQTKVVVNACFIMLCDWCRFVSWEWSLRASPPWLSWSWWREETWRVTCAPSDLKRYCRIYNIL